jgi:hypothetical protein
MSQNPEKGATMKSQSVFPSLSSVAQFARRRSSVLLMGLAIFGAVRIPAWSAGATDIIWLESNSTSGNSILTFKNNGSGSPTFLGNTPAGGIGVFDSTFALGPFDSDQNLLVSPDGTLLFAVNSGSISIAVFHIMVLLNVMVTDEYERVVTGLNSDNFRVFDDKVEQQIVSFSTQDTPISVGLIFDSSGSMSDKIQKSREAVAQFFKTSNPQDEFLLINFSEKLKQVSGFTSRYENLQKTCSPSRQAVRQHCSMPSTWASMR